MISAKQQISFFLFTLSLRLQTFQKYGQPRKNIRAKKKNKLFCHFKINS